MLKASQLVQFCHDMVGMPYWYGTCVYACTSSLLRSKARQYPSHYSSSRMPRYKKDVADRKVCMDCIGMIKGFFWTDGGTGVREYLNGGKPFTKKYASNGFPDKGANGMLAWLKSKGCKNGKMATLPDVPGILLFSSGHVGVYVGAGYAVEARGFSYGVVKTKVESRSWTAWSYLPESILEYDTISDALIGNDAATEPSTDAPDDNEDHSPFPIKVKSWSVNVRNSPNIKTGKIMRVVRMNTLLTAVGVDAKTGWYKLSDGNYISNKYAVRV